MARVSRSRHWYEIWIWDIEPALLQFSAVSSICSQYRDTEDPCPMDQPLFHFHTIVDNKFSIAWTFGHANTFNLSYPKEKEYCYFSFHNILSILRHTSFSVAKLVSWAELVSPSICNAYLNKRVSLSIIKCHQASSSILKCHQESSSVFLLQY